MIGLPLQVEVEFLIAIAIAEFIAFLYFFFRFVNKQNVHNAVTEQRLKAIDKELNNKKEGDPTIREMLVEMQEVQHELQESQYELTEKLKGVDQ